MKLKDFGDDRHLDVCRDIEVVLAGQYELDPDMTDVKCAFALDQARIAVKQAYGFAQNERVSTDAAIAGIIRNCVALGAARIGKINDLTLKEYVLRLEKIKGSVTAHSRDGPRSYYLFVRRFLPDA